MTQRYSVLPLVVVAVLALVCPAGADPSEFGPVDGGAQLTSGELIGLIEAGGELPEGVRRETSSPSGDGSYRYWEEGHSPYLGCADGSFVQVLVRVHPDGRREATGETRCPPEPTEPAPAAPVVAPSDVRETVDLPRPTVGLSPTVTGLVGLETWLWADDIEPVTVTATLGGTTVVATASPTELTWDTGDGHTYAVGEPGAEDRPAATHAYRHHGTYDVVVTVTWTGTYTVNGGAPQPLGTVTTSSTRRYEVDEVQAVRER